LNAAPVMMRRLWHSGHVSPSRKAWFECQRLHSITGAAARRQPGLLSACCARRTATLLTPPKHAPPRARQPGWPAHSLPARLLACVALSCILKWLAVMVMVRPALPKPGRGARRLRGSGFCARRAAGGGEPWLGVLWGRKAVVLNRLQGRWLG
jgi:hypothetical protein